MLQRQMCKKLHNISPIFYRIGFTEMVLTGFRSGVLNSGWGSSKHHPFSLGTMAQGREPRQYRDHGQHKDSGQNRDPGQGRDPGQALSPGLGLLLENLPASLGSARLHSSMGTEGLGNGDAGSQQQQSGKEAPGLGHLQMRQEGITHIPPLQTCVPLEQSRSCLCVQPGLGTGSQLLWEHCGSLSHCQHLLRG